MLFTTPTFLFLFLPIFILVYYLTPDRGEWRNYIALIASILFFSWAEPVYMFFLIAAVYIDYLISNLISKNSALSPARKSLLLWIGVLLNVAVLIAFKYTTFIISEVLLPLKLYSSQRPEANFPLLLGISFITFHKISYLVDSFKGRVVPSGSFYDCALYIFLFPKLISGPIIRYHDIDYQINHRTYASRSFLVGCFRFSIGFSKKVLIADPLGLVADRIFALPVSELLIWYAWAGAFAYMLQIYFDFSGYSDMAIGLGRMIGFRFPENFNRPYTSVSITEFWRRWHITLSSWMRLYLYIPLGGNRVSKTRSFVNLWIVFLISGLWHGANWTFLVWGAYYGLFLCIEKYASEIVPAAKDYLPSFARFLLTMIIVIFGWVIFRSATLSYAIDFMKVMVGFSQPQSYIQPWGLLFGNRDLFLLFIGAIIVFVKVPNKYRKLPNWLSCVWSESMTVYGTGGQISMTFLATIALFLVSVMAMLSSEYVPFLYFRF
jgi:alginate O-acetyltransferase complex protein AlgI